MASEWQVVSLHRYLCWANFMRHQFLQEIDSDEPKENEPGVMSRAGHRTYMYYSLWLALLYVACEGWAQLKLDDSNVDRLLASPHLKVLKQFRHGVFHYQKDYFDLKSTVPVFEKGGDFFRWADDTHTAIYRYVEADIAARNGPESLP
jgi:hypothetical protein